MKLDVTAMRYLTKEHFRVLTSIEMGMKNHEVVPVELIASIAKLRHGGVQKILSHLLRNKLIAHDGNAYDGFRLTYSGYDYLALRIGVGKESDIYLATQEDGTEVAIKFHRLGRTSFRAVKSKRDYLKNRKSVSWFYMSRLSAMKEYAFLKALYDRDFPTPTPIDCNRHAICMSLVDGYPLNQVRRLANSKDAYDTAMSIVVRLAEYGLVHCDFNEFNIMIGDDGKITMIDFPQMISTSHPNASELFDRDVHGLVKFFSRLQGGAYTPDRVPKLMDIVADENVRLDEDVEASGFGKEFGEKVHDLSIFSAHQNVEESDSDDDDNEDESEEEGEGEDEAKDDGEVPDLVQGVDATTLDGQAGEEDSGDDVDEETQDAFAVENEIIKQRARQKAGGKRRSRNSAKLSIKGKLYHKNDW
ncbi:Serine/threonine-protein kinase Rio2 [Phytophthora cactorum]|nr:Serine/threonine-protein kinase Rio2 [Phytophthora cactorum]